MPYIPQECREDLDTDQRPPATPGELNYKITRLLVDYLGNSPTYATYNSVVGALECAKLELYRRTVVPYEEVKRDENGDVYPPEKGVTDGEWAVVRWLSCDEYHAHDDSCTYLRAMRTEDAPNQGCIVSRHHTQHEATTEAGRLDDAGAN